MALFPLKFPSWRKRDPAGVGIGPGAATDTVDTLRRRARQRLIGTALLVLAGIFGFPLLFDSQPRPLPVEMRVEVPDRDKVAPLVVAPAAPAVSAAPKPAPTAAPVVPVAPPTVAAAPVAAAPTSSAPPPVPVRTEPVAAPKPEPKAETKAEAKPEPKPEPRPVAKVEPKPEVKAEVKAEVKPAPAKTEAKPEPKPEPKPAAAPASVATAAGNPPQPVADADARFIVQIGAFADDARVRDVRARVERAGLKTYIHTIDTPDGKRTRVRVGPYATRADAEKAAERLRSIDLPGAILTL